VFWMSQSGIRPLLPYSVEFSEHSAKDSTRRAFSVPHIASNNASVRLVRCFNPLLLPKVQHAAEQEVLSSMGTPFDQLKTLFNCSSHIAEQSASHTILFEVRFSHVMLC